MCCNLELKTLNNWKMTALLRNHRKHRVCSDPSVCTTQQYSFFFSKVLHEVWRIFPRSFDIVVTFDAPTQYLIQNKRESSLILSTTSGTSCDLSWMTSFSRPHGVSLFGNIERCVVVSFSGLTLAHQSDIEHALCAFSGVYWEFCCCWEYKFSADLGVRNESTVKSGIFLHRRFENCFFILSRVQRRILLRWGNML